MLQILSIGIPNILLRKTLLLDIVSTGEYCYSAAGAASYVVSSNVRMGCTVNECNQ